jgi:hypothetical protein
LGGSGRGASFRSCKEWTGGSEVPSEFFLVGIGGNESVSDIDVTGVLLVGEPLTVEVMELMCDIESSDD